MKNSTELKKFLLNQMVLVSEKKQGVDEAKAICNYAAQVYNQANIELKTAVAKRRFTELVVSPVDFEGGDYE